MSEEKVSSNKGTSALCAFERPLFGICYNTLLAPHRAREKLATLLYVRDLSCRLRCSLLEKALLQNWHLYFFSGAPPEALRVVEGDAVAGATRVMAAAAVAGISIAQSSFTGYALRVRS